MVWYDINNIRTRTKEASNNLTWGGNSEIFSWATIFRDLLLVSLKQASNGIKGKFKLLCSYANISKKGNKMDLLQETSSIWNEFLTKPCPWVDLLSFWPRHPWHLLIPVTLENLCPLTPLAPFKPWHLLFPDTFVTVHYTSMTWKLKSESRL